MIPQTYSGSRVAEYCNKILGRTDIVGDGDPIDICVITEKIVPYGDVILSCRPIGGLRMIDGGEADDKIIAVMNDDAVYNERYDVSVLPKTVINRLKHYFLTYKQPPDLKEPKCEITHVYGREEAYQIIEHAREDYREKFPQMEEYAELMNSGNS
jgi:inorganic pyrophosphatase